MSGRLGDELLQLRASTRRLVRAGVALRALGSEARARAIHEAAARLRDQRHAYGRALRRELLTSTGLSSQAIEWGLTTSLDALSVPALSELAERAHGQPCELAAVVLAGNVFSAALRPLALPLLLGVPVIAKASSRDDAMARYLRKALTETEPALGGACEVLTFAREQRPLTGALLAHAQVVSVYGSDETVEQLRGLATHATLVARGHGLGAAFVSAGSLRGDATEIARKLALDVAAYDQRGCLSPHAVLVEDDAAGAPGRFAELLAQALDEVGAQMPRGELPAEAAAAQMQWRGVAAARGVLHEGGAYAVGFEGEAALRATPGHRNVGVYACASEQNLAGRLQDWSRHLKALGVAGDEALRTRLAALAPYVCEVGAMQAPPLSARLDGLDPLHGLECPTQS